MTTASRSVAVVATRLPITDRRALSQAWYSALHVAQSQPPAAAPQAAPNNAGAGVRVGRDRSPGRGSGVGPVPGAGRRHDAAHGTPTLPGGFDRRVPATDLTRRLERALTRHLAPVPARQATIAIKAGDGRIALILRGDADATRVIAICAPHLRERVDRALAHARFALAANGTRLDAAPARTMSASLGVSQA